MESKSSLFYFLTYGFMMILSNYLTISFGKPFTNCGGMIRTVGSFISLKESVSASVSCTWSLQPLQGQILYMRVESFSIKSEAIREVPRLEIRTNQTTDQGILHTFFGQDHEELDSQPDTGFLHDGVLYIQYRGHFNPEVDQLSVVFASFSITEKQGCKLFTCKNGRCIAPRLMCDTHDHCGDMSDEKSSICQSEKLKPLPTEKPSKTNYSESTATMFGIVTMSTLGIIFTILICVSMFRRSCERYHSSIPSPRMAIASVQSIGAYVHRLNSASEENQRQTSDENLPPSYYEVVKNKNLPEPPPSYNSIIHNNTSYTQITHSDSEFQMSPVHQMYCEHYQNQQNLNFGEGIVNDGYIDESQGQYSILNELSSHSLNTIAKAFKSSENSTPASSPAVLQVSSEVCISRTLSPSVISDITLGPENSRSHLLQYPQDSTSSKC